MREPVWWDALLAASEHLAEFAAEHARGWREHNASDVPADQELPEDREMPRGIRIVRLGEEFKSNSDISTEERRRVLAVLDEALGDTSDPKRHQHVIMFLRLALDLDMLRELWPSLGIRVRRVCFLMSDVWPAGAPEWMTVDTEQSPPWKPAVVARIREDGRDTEAPGEPVVTDPFAVEQLADPDAIVTWAPPEAIAAWSDLAGQVKAELERVGISATIETRYFDPTPGLHIDMSLSMAPYGVALRWYSPLENSKKYRDDLLAQDRTELLAYSVESSEILQRAALDVLAAAGFQTMVYYYFPHDRGCEYRVLAPPRHPIT